MWPLCRQHKAMLLNVAKRGDRGVRERRTSVVRIVWAGKQQVSELQETGLLREVAMKLRRDSIALVGIIKT